MKLKTADRAGADRRARRRLAPARRRQGVSKDEIRIGSIQDLSGPIAGFGKQLAPGHDAARRRGQRAGRRQRPQAQAAGRGLGLRPEERGAGGAEAGQPGQDLHDGRPHRHARRTWRRCRCSSRRTSSTSCRSPRRARCTSRFHKLKYSLRRHLLRPDAHRPAQAGRRRRAPRRSARSTRTTSSGSRCCAAPRPASRRSAWSWSRRPATSAARPTSRRQVAQDEGRQLRLRRARHHHPRDHRHDRRERARPASTRPSSAPARPTPT